MFNYSERGSDSNSSTQTSPYNSAEKVFVVGVMVMISMGSILGNAMVFYAYVKEKKLQRPTNYFILSLAAADLFVSIFAINIYTMYLVVGYWPLGNSMCLLWLSLDYWVFQASVFGVLMIAIDRYLSIRFPHGYRHRRTDSKVRFAILTNWVVSFLLWVPLIITYAYGDQEEIHKNQCHIGSENDLLVTIIASGCAYVLPVLLMVCLAIHSLFLLLRIKSTLKSKDVRRDFSCVRDSCSTLHKSSSDSTECIHEPCDHAHEVYPGSKGSIYKGRGNSLKKIIVHSKEVVTVLSDVRTVCKTYYKSLDTYQRIATFNIILTIAFVATIFPHGVMSVVSSSCQHCVSAQWWRFANIASYMNSLLNPLCYAFGNKNFNTAFKKILLPAKKGKRNQSIPVKIVNKTEDGFHLEQECFTKC